MRDRNPAGGLASGVALVCIGCVLIAIGLALGGRFVLPGYWPGAGNESGPAREWGEGEATTMKQNGTIPAQVRTIQIRLKASSLVIREGTEFAYETTDFNRDTIRISSTGSVFSIEEEDWHTLLNLGPFGARREIRLTVPAGQPIDDCSITVGAGSIRIERFSPARFFLESGAGSVKGYGLRTGEARLETGAGSIDLSDCSFGESRFETGAGSIRFSGSLAGDSVIDTGAGSIRFTLDGSAADWRVDYTRGLGSVRVDGQNYSGVGNGTAGNPSASRRIRLSTGVGSATIDFTKSPSSWSEPAGSDSRGA